MSIVRQAPWPDVRRSRPASSAPHNPSVLDVHDVADTTQPIQEGWVLTVEPAIYLPAEGFAVRLENDILVGANGNLDLMGDIPIEAGEIEKLMRR